jgi:hypothetical protein
MDTAAVLPCPTIIALGLTTCDADASSLGNANYGGILVSQMCRVTCETCGDAQVTLAPPPPPAPPRPECSMLQEAVMEQCNAHCDTCEVETVATILVSAATTCVPSLALHLIDSRPRCCRRTASSMMEAGWLSTRSALLYQSKQNKAGNAPPFRLQWPTRAQTTAPAVTCEQ